MNEKLILGAICGDIVGSPYEFSPIKSKEFEFINQFSEFTDDTVMTIVNMEWLLDIKEGETEEECKERLISLMHEIGIKYPNCGYGGHFYGWLVNKHTEPYYSWGNGSAMRVSPIGWMFDTLDDVMKYAKISAEVTHNHPEGIKGAQAIASCVYLARQGKTKSEIQKFVEETFEYDLSRELKDFQKEYRFDVSCMGSVPEAIICFLESETYEDAIRNCVWLGGDCDTTGAMCGAIAEAFYGCLNEELMQNVMNKLDESMKEIVIKFSKMIISKR